MGAAQSTEPLAKLSEVIVRYARGPAADKNAEAAR